MRQEPNPNMTSFSNGRGPFVGTTNVLVNNNTVMPAQILCGVATNPEVEGAGQMCVTVVGQYVNWWLACNDPVQCETVAQMLEAMKFAYSKQLQDMGFVENTWMRLVGKPDDGSDQA